VYDWLLFLHLIAAFLLAVTIVMYSAVALGATTDRRMLFVADRCWDVGGLGTLIFGIWLALNLEQYDFFDFWILLALVLWLVATGLGQSVQRRIGGDDARAVALGATTSPRMLFVADRCWDVGGLGTLIFGIWLALNLDQYDFFDGWILLALFLWFVATGLGQSVQRRIGGDDIRSVIALHWIRTIVVIGLLVTMIWKPGA